MIKVGDTISDIKEGTAAGVISVGILEGSSLMGLTKQEYEQLSETEKAERKKTIKQKSIKLQAHLMSFHIWENCRL